MFGLTWNALTIFLSLLILFVIGSIYVVRVPRGKVYLVERFGQYHRTLAPGFAVIAPMTNRIAHKVDVERQYWIDFEIDCGGTKVVFDGIGDLTITDPVKACYSVANLDEALNAFLEEWAKSGTRKMKARDVVADKARIEREGLRALQKAARAYGAEVKTLELDVFEG